MAFLSPPFTKCHFCLQAKDFHLEWFLEETFSKQSDLLALTKEIFKNPGQIFQIRKLGTVLSFDIWYSITIFYEF